jgi:hypothetical protein
MDLLDLPIDYLIIRNFGVDKPWVILPNMLVRWRYRMSVTQTGNAVFGRNTRHIWSLCDATDFRHEIRCQLDTVTVPSSGLLPIPVHCAIESPVA